MSKPSNTKRHDKRTARYAGNLRVRAAHGDTVAERILADGDRTKTGHKARHCVSFPHCIHTGRKSDR